MKRVTKVRRLKYQDGGRVSMSEPKQDGFAKNNFFNRVFNRNNILEEQIRDEYGALKRIPLRKMHVDLAQGADAETLEQLRHNPEFIGPEEGIQDVQFGNVRIPKGKMWVNDDAANPQFIGVRYPGDYTTLIDPRGLSKERLKAIAANDFVSHALHGDPVYDGLTQELGNLLLKKIGANDLQINGGVDAYIRGLISDDPEYDVYRQEMGFVPQELKDRIVSYVKRGSKGLRRAQRGGVSVDGYRRDSPDRFNDFNVIPSNRITMRGVDHAVLGIDDRGVGEVMLPGRDYVFPGRAVLEVPMMDKGGFYDINNYNNKTNVMMDSYFSSPFYGYQPVMPGYGMPYAMGRPLPRRYYQTGGTVDEALTGATRVNTAPTKYSRKVVRNGRTYYIDEGATAGNVQRAISSTTPTSAATQQRILDWLASGVTPEELVRQGHIHPSRMEEFRTYYKPRVSAVYTDAPPPPPPAPYDPTVGFNGEPIYRGNVLDAMIRYPSGASGSADKPAQVMYVDKMGQYDPSRGYYELSPAELRRMTGGLRHWGDTTGMSQYRVPVPRDLPAADVVAGRRFQWGGGYYNPFYPNDAGNFFFR